MSCRTLNAWARISLSTLAIIMSLFVITWFGAVYHGPGRPKEGDRTLPNQKAQLPAALADAFASGKHCVSGPSFDGKEEWCGKCSSWKPPLASHCKICDRCCFFLDHHCTLIGKCVGFRNLRNFIVLLTVGQVIHGYLVICILHRLACHGLPEDNWEWVKLVFWVVYIVQGTWFVRSRLNELLVPYSRGWLSRVHYIKFHNLMADASALSRELAAEPGLRATWEELYKAYEAVMVSGSEELCKSPFSEEMPKTSYLERIFGESLSWR
eukprot:TRINITY_DN65606_c0_g1_i1.p1 TRINITY_DN65606_c0_g1~~TRINITY_DN65606_c0_g1_i1.p1  ORF type:complete len:267 (-),score=25.95 TRINITY_DN65606_c0_g1_i1:255-1055(-)